MYTCHCHGLTPCHGRVSWGEDDLSGWWVGDGGFGLGVWVGEFGWSGALAFPVGCGKRKVWGKLESLKKWGGWEMQVELDTVEREGARTRSGQKPREMSPKSLANLTAKGKGRPPGTPNKVNKTIREAVLEAVQPGHCHPEGLKGWLVERALGGIEDRKIFAGVVSRVIPIEITGEGGGAVKVDLGWLSGRKIGGDVIDITPTTQTAGEQAAARLPTDFQSEAPGLSPAAPIQAEPCVPSTKA